MSLDDDIRAADRRESDFLGSFGLIRRDGRTLFVCNERVIGGRVVETWDLPGGQVEPGELLEEALTRELREEIDIEVRGPTPFVFCQEGERLSAGVRRFAWRSFFFRVDEFAGEPNAQGEIRGLAWLTDAELAPRLQAPYHDSFLRWVRHGGTMFRSAWID